MEKNLNKKLKLEKITSKDKGWAVDAIESKKIVEKAEDANEPTRVEPEVVEPVDMDYGTQKKIADREERIKAIIAKRLKPHKDIAKETKSEDKAVLGKDIKLKESFSKQDILDVFDFLDDYDLIDVNKSTEDSLALKNLTSDNIKKLINNLCPGLDYDILKQFLSIFTGETLHKLVTDNYANTTIAEMVTSDIDGQLVGYEEYQKLGIAGYYDIIVKAFHDEYCPNMYLEDVLDFFKEYVRETYSNADQNASKEESDRYEKDEEILNKELPDIIRKYYGRKIVKNNTTIRNLMAKITKGLGEGLGESKEKTKVVIFDTHHDAYSEEDAAEDACTVEELIDWLQSFNGNEKVIYAFDGGYTYGSVSTDDVFSRTLKKDEDELEEASTAEKKSLKLGGKATDDLARGRGIASIKDRDERDAALAVLKAGRKDLVDKEFIGDRKNLHIENDLDRKTIKMQQAMAKEFADDDVDAKCVIDEAQAQALIGTQETLNESAHQESHLNEESCQMVDSQTLATMQDDDNI